MQIDFRPMGQSKNKKAEFFDRHPLCCFCGGKEIATTIDHIPSRSFFTQRDWPLGYEFPACGACNKDSGLAEAVAAAFSRMAGSSDQGAKEGADLFAGAVSNDHKLGLEFFGPIRTSKLVFPKSVTDQLVDPSGNQRVLLGERFRTHFDVFMRKLCKALYYKHTLAILKNDNTIKFAYVSNAQRGQPTEEIINRSEFPNRASLQRSSKDKKRPPISDQFDYSFLVQKGGLAGFKIRLYQTFLVAAFINPDGFAD